MFFLFPFEPPPFLPVSRARKVKALFVHPVTVKQQQLTRAMKQQMAEERRRRVKELREETRRRGFQKKELPLIFNGTYVYPTRFWRMSVAWGRACDLHVPLLHKGRECRVRAHLRLRAKILWGPFQIDLCRSYLPISVSHCT